jgi:hypothetical protein
VKKNRNKNKKKSRLKHARDNFEELNDATTRGGPPKAMAMAQAQAQSEEGDDESTTSAVTKV